jgi:hypothetical protein
MQIRSHQATARDQERHPVAGNNALSSAFYAQLTSLGVLFDGTDPVSRSASCVRRDLDADDIRGLLA